MSVVHLPDVLRSSRCGLFASEMRLERWCRGGVDALKARQKNSGFIFGLWQSGVQKDLGAGI